MKRKWAVSSAGVMVAVLTMGATTAYAGDGGNGIPQQIAKLFADISSLQQTAQSHTNDIATLQSNQSSQQNEINQLEGAVNNLASTLQSMQSDAKSLHDQLDTLSQTVNSQQTEISNLESEVAQLQSGGGQNQGGTGGSGGIGGTGGNGGTSPSASPYSVTGTMVDAAGKPFFFSGLELIPINGGTPIQYSFVQNSTTTGAFAFNNVPNGTYQIHFYLPEYQVANPTPITVSNQSISGLTIHLAETTYSILGKALDSNGNPLVGQPITLEDASGNIQGDGLTTDVNGSFTLPGIPNGTYTLIVGPWNATGPIPVVRTTVTVNNGDVNLGTISLHTVTGTMYDASGAQAGTPLYLVGADGTTHFIDHMTDAGQFVYTNISDGTYTVTTKDAMYPVSSPQTITVSGQNVTNLNVKLGVNLYSVTFKVLQNGQPFVGNVYIKDSSQTFTGGPFTTASDGTFTAYGIAPGTWTIYTGADSSHLSPLGTVTVTDGSSVVQVGQ